MLLMDIDLKSALIIIINIMINNIISTITKIPHISYFIHKKYIFDEQVMGRVLL